MISAGLSAMTMKSAAVLCGLFGIILSDDGLGAKVADRLLAVDHAEIDALRQQHFGPVRRSGPIRHRLHFQ
jgi:hypothetical protein